MRIIYEDGNYRDENENDVNQSHKAENFIDISSMSDEYKKKVESEEAPGKPYRPAATLRPAPNISESKPEKSDAGQIPTQPQPVYTQAPYAPQGYGGEQPAAYYQYPQGYPVQYQQGMYTPMYPAQYPYPQGYPMQYPQGQYPQQMPYVQPQPPTGAEMNAGTRVLYQSPDFDKNESANPDFAMNYTSPQPKRSSITQEDVVFVSAKTARPVGNVPMPEKKFDVDDMEMSVFELNSMAHKYHAKTKAYKNPSSKESSLEVEEYEENVDFYEDAEQDEEPVVRQQKKKESKKKSSRKAKEAVRKIVLSVSVVAIIVSLFFLWNEYRLSKRNEQEGEMAHDLIIDDSFLYVNPETDEGDSSTDEEPDNGGPDEMTEEERQAAILKKWEEVREEYPNVNFPSNLQLKYAKLYGSNQDFVGYLSADGVGLNLPVVQTDNDEYYLKKSFFGENTKYGCPFVTHLNNISEDVNGLDMNTVIFGHHMNDGSVFGALDNYKSIEGFKAAPVITFNTLYHDYSWKVVAAFITNAYEKEDNGYVFKYYFTNLSSEERFSAFLNALSERSLYYTGVDVLPTDKILTLSTCSHEFEEARFVVVARLVRNGEIPEVDTSKATKNDNPRYPQAYYDKKKLDNPYKDAYRWEVG